MQLSITTWNVNSVRFRINLVARFIKAARPDVLCLQETKCPDDKFPMKRFRRLGYEHVAMNGQKGYHGVAILSRFPFETTSTRGFCGKTDCRHVSVTLGEKAKLKDPLTLHNLYVPAGGDVPDPALNPKFEHKLSFLDEMRECTDVHVKNGERAVLLGDLNVAPLEHDVWSHKQLLDVVSHTPIECEKLGIVQGEGRWVDAVRMHRPEPEKVFTWWSYRGKEWEKSNRGRRLDHVWLSESLAPNLADTEIVRHTRNWERPSDHVPVIVNLDV